ncbi:MAG: hypothetical protein A4E24_00520 [Methanomethylovorans sp. PtaU1.Bin093]|nr:MAG: hypothetical protein A4E24_00520 [Methanomethylovorans sp. PtaU1.Bin093]
MNMIFDLLLYVLMYTIYFASLTFCLSAIYTFEVKYVFDLDGFLCTVF